MPESVKVFGYHSSEISFRRRSSLRNVSEEICKKQKVEIKLQMLKRKNF